jgi:dTMP kinase
MGDPSWLGRLSGRFIVFEGPDGSGKSTQFRRFSAACQRGGVRVCEVREPGGTYVGERIRAVLLDHAEEEICLTAEMLLYMASRAQLVESRVRPALARGELVLADRYVSSTLAYQGAAGGMPLDEIRAVAAVATGGLKPDLTVIFDVDQATAATRLSPLLDRMEARGREYHERVREGYLAQWRTDPARHARIDAARGEDDVFRALLAEMEARSAGWAR